MEYAYQNKRMEIGKRDCLKERGDVLITEHGKGILRGATLRRDRERGVSETGVSDQPGSRLGRKFARDMNTNLDRRVPGVSSTVAKVTFH